MALPRKLKHGNIFMDGENWIGVAEDFTPAKLSQKFEAYRGGGMMGAANIHMGLEDGALDTSFTFGGAEAALVKRMGLAKIDGVALRFAGSFQRDDTGEIVSVEIVQRGRFKELDRGTFKSGDNTQSKVSMVNTYYKETMNGVVLCEIDLLNMIWIVDGVDLMAEHRKAIGL
ncbi:phage major tail tube protein [Aeromonas caviae]|jgi:P2 family phage contractile tail tube protein|uniref:phage major tail tube protein n=1 Tax=Aeromonas TaxID=642 RepID=UPI0022E10A9C|nr:MULTISPECIES: phage major tail tube protein [Aeromonas]MDX7797888.1 phage major tail tube protein [Aeromonas caviae]MDX7811260.1 phage major tail tube protein [Aeromonas caviae]MDX7846041.1 phage major tail tube protein [Aeromonas caviae]